MFANKSSKRSDDLVDQAIKSTQRVANDALESLAGAVRDLRQVEPLLNRARAQVGALAERGVDAVHATSQQLSDKARRASDKTISCVKDEPVKAILIAAAAGAALMALLSYSRSRR